jgi:hypothetical protein
MKALVVYESMFGNTEKVAKEIAAGLSESMQVDINEVSVAPRPGSGDYDVIVVGGPTHALTMSTTRSRRDAWVRGARMGVMRVGMREWIGELAAPQAAVIAAFDTRVGSVRHLPGSAARAASRLLRRRGAGSVVSPHSFYVDKEKGPLHPGELAAARSWGRALAQLAAKPAKEQRAR